jgi:hypothetical protein
LMTTDCIHKGKHHIVPHKYAQILYVNQKIIINKECP